MPVLRYSLYNIIGGAAWIVLLLFAGYLLGNVPFFKAHFSLVTVAIILVSLVPAVVAALQGKSAKA
jgi:membrane-associated protein